MTSRSSLHRRMFSLIVSLALVLAVSLLFGQVLGNLYLGNIAANDSKIKTDLIGETSGKIKVLRLKTIPYYTILVATYEERESALRLGKSLAEKGLPVIITGTSPNHIKLGLLNNEERLIPLAQSISVDGKRAGVQKGEINSISFKFANNDTYSAEKIAPFLGELSLCLEKAMLLNSDLDTNNANVSKLKPKFIELAEDVEGLGKRSLELAKEGQDSKHVTYLADLSVVLYNWGQSLAQLGTNWGNAQLLISQQQALVVIDEYQRFLNSTN